ncbi:ABC transporter C-terminal domain-containing protein, partial [Actinotignum timonense]|nr:ABC transporter C-terminal domain-containing protein [Actinotignum timonense]
AFSCGLGYSSTPYIFPKAPWKQERSTACAVSGDYEELARIGKELSEATGQLDELEEQWLEAAEVAEG